MLQSFLIVFRESLETALVVGIVLSYLRRTGRQRSNPLIFAALLAGMLASAATALLFQRLAGGLEGRMEQIFEGSTMLVGAALLTTLILWMMGRTAFREELERRVEARLSGSNRLGLFLLVFFAVFREGVETVLFLRAASLTSPDNNFPGALLGLAAAALLGYALFRGSLRLNIKAFFYTTNVLLILFAAGLVAHGVNELQEAGLLPALIEQLWDTNSLLPEEGLLGSIARGLFGYNGNPSLIEAASYGAYLLLALSLWTLIKRRMKGQRKP